MPYAFIARVFYILSCVKVAKQPWLSTVFMVNVNVFLLRGGRIVWINVFTAKPGKLDELVATQAEELLNFTGKGVPGWISSRWHRSVDSNKTIMITTFESIEFHKSWLKKMTFRKT